MGAGADEPLIDHADHALCRGDAEYIGNRTVRAAGLVTCRQRPGTAGDTIFVTLEDETGTINVIVWHDLARRQRRELLASRLLGVAGTVQKQDDVVHLIAVKLFDHSRLLGRLDIGSRDFH